MSKDTRNVPALRFKGFSDAWEKRKLGEIADIRGGGTPSTSKPEYWDGEIDWYAPAEIGTQRYVSGSRRQITNLGLNKSSATMLPANKTILFTSRAGIGNAAILTKSGATNQGFQSIVVKPATDIYFLYSEVPEIKRKAIRLAAGSTFLEISGKSLSKIQIWLPSFKEQSRIGHLFLQIDNLIAATQDKLDHFEEIKKALLKHLFDQSMRFKGYSDPWEKRKLIYFLNVSDQKNSKGTFSKKDVLSVSGEFGIVNQIQFQGRSFAGVSVKKYGIVEKGDIVYTKSPLKRNPFGIIKVNRGQAGIVSTLYAIYKPRKTVCPSIIDYYFQSDTKLNNYLRPLVNKGAKNDMKVKNIDVLKGLVILPLNLDEQKKDIFFLDNITNLIAATQSKLSSLESLKKALLQGLFI